jgi:hypothetical protein
MVLQWWKSAWNVALPGALEGNWPGSDDNGAPRESHFNPIRQSQVETCDYGMGSFFGICGHIANRVG